MKELARFATMVGMDVTRTSRSWFRFSLRTLFVLVTVLCVWLGWHVKWINDRHQALIEFADWSKTPNVGEPLRNAPWSLRLLGEEPIQWMALEPDSGKKEADRKRLQGLFPEAEIGEWTYPTPKNDRHSP
jgi:hypothetical protein